MAVEVPATLSPSKLGRFMSCPLSFRFAYIDKLPEAPTAAQLRGTVVHRALQLLFGEAEASHRTEQAALGALDRAFKELESTDDMTALGLSELETETFHRDARALVTKYFAIEDPTTIVPIGVELDVRVSLDGIELRGIIDRLDRLPDGDIVVTDYKTGRSPRPEQSRSRLLGVQFYAYLCQEAFGVRPSEVRLIYLADQVVIVDSPNDQSMRGLRARALAVWDAVERACATEDFRPNPTALCRTCAFQDRCTAYQEIRTRRATPARSRNARPNG